MLEIKSDNTQRVRDVLYVYRRIINRYNRDKIDIPPIIKKRYRQLQARQDKIDLQKMGV